MSSARVAVSVILLFLPGLASSPIQLQRVNCIGEKFRQKSPQGLESSQAVRNPVRAILSGHAIGNLCMADRVAVETVDEWLCAPPNHEKEEHASVEHIANGTTNTR